MNNQPCIAFFPEASFGAALNCVGIAQELRRLGARPVFICQEGFRGVFSEYGFAEYYLVPSGKEPEIDWTDFINKHRHAFQKSALDQVEDYVAPTWDAIVDTAIRAEEPLRHLISQLKPDAMVLDNVVLFPAIANSGVPWIRVVSCAETELPDENVPPYLSGCQGSDQKSIQKFRARYTKAVAPAHKRLNGFLVDCHLRALPELEFLPPSPYLNLLLSPEIVRYDRAEPLDPERFVYLDGCVRKEAAYVMPHFAAHENAPLVLVSFGSLGAMDVELIQRMIRVFADLPCRFIVNVGPWRDDYLRVPDNVYLESWFPQPSVVEQSQLFIHHGGNNSFCEALYYGVPSLIMPYCWDGHDNAARAVEIGAGGSINRYNWTDDELRTIIQDLLSNEVLGKRLKSNSVKMKAAAGTTLAAQSIMNTAKRNNKLK